MNYSSGNSSLFATIAREQKGRYKLHYDYQYRQWNVFNPQGYYVCSFTSLEAAKQFCDAANEEINDAAEN